MEEQKKEEKAEKINVLFFHGSTNERSWNANNRFTLAGVIHRDGHTDVLVLGIAMCSKGDHFTKSQGRELAEKRLFDVKEPKGRVYHSIKIPVGSEVKMFNAVASGYNMLKKDVILTMFGLGNQK